MGDGWGYMSDGEYRHLLRVDTVLPPLPGWAATLCAVEDVEVGLPGGSEAEWGHLQPCGGACVSGTCSTRTWSRDSAGILARPACAACAAVEQGGPAPTTDVPPNSVPLEKPGEPCQFCRKPVPAEGTCLDCWTPVTDENAAEVAASLQFDVDFARLVREEGAR